MLRIHVEQSVSQARVRLEGRLGGEWVRELEHCCRGLLDPSGLRQLTIDLDAVSFVDPEGQRLLAELHACGASLTAKGPLTKYLVSRIQETSDCSDAPSG